MSVQLLRALARVVLVVSVSGAVPHWTTQADGADSGDLRAVRTAGAVELISASRPAEGSVLARDVLRRVALARWNHAGPGLPARSDGLTAPGIHGTIVRHDIAARRLASIAAPPLRGPPHSI